MRKEATEYLNSFLKKNNIKDSEYEIDSVVKQSQSNNKPVYMFKIISPEYRLTLVIAKNKEDVWIANRHTSTVELTTEDLEIMIKAAKEYYKKHVLFVNKMANRAKIRNARKVQV